MPLINSLSRVFLLILFLAFAIPAQAATLQATVDRNQISMNETLRLTVRYDQQVESSLLDTKALEADFEVLAVSPQSSSSMSIVNGQSTRTEATVWTIVLAPKKTGNLNIPAFSLNGTRSQAIQIKVGSGSATGTQSAPLLAVVSADRDRIYPGQQLLVEVEISAANDVRDLNGPQLIINNAEVEPLGQQSFQRIDNGVARQIVILKYAVFTNQPGELSIPVMTYTGNKGGSRSFFGNRGQQVIARSKQFAITVEAAPQKANTTWLPAEQVELQSSWSGDIAALKVGEPVTRTITVTANGQRASAIPPLTVSSTENNYKSYKDQPQLDTQTTNNGLIGRRIESEAIVATQEGELVLPEVKLDWWDVKTEQWQQAILPAETLQVTGIANSVTSDTPQIDGATQTIVNTDDSARLWQALTALLTLICLAQFWWILRSPRSNNATESQTENTNEKQAWQALQQSLAKQDTNLIRRDLISWGQIILPDSKVVNLRSLSQNFPSEELKQALSNLEAQIYKEDGQLDTQRLGQALQQLRSHFQNQQRTGNKTQADLKPLYQ